MLLGVSHKNLSFGLFTSHLLLLINKMASELNINISSIPYIGTYVPFPEPEERPDPIIPDPGNSLSWVHVSLKQTAQESIPRIPSDVVMVIDNSGSMGESSRVEANGEYSPLNLLDIVKHAVRTVVATLGEHDRLSIVQFSNDARIVCDLTYMTNDEKTRILALVDRMEPDEATNLWDGLRTGISILNNANRSMPQHNGRGDIVLTTPPSKKRNSAVMLLTDGQPTSDLTPREGIIEAMKNYITYVCNGQCPGIISTFGFSYGCEYDLMRDIAFEGGGMYSFIPDSGFVGTAFINSLANTLSTFTNDARLEITGQNGTLFHDVKWANPYKFVYNPYKYTTIIGSLQVEQTRDIIVLVEHPSTVTSNFVKVRLDCHVVDSTLLLTETSVPTVLEKEGPAPGSNTDEMCAETTLQFYRQVVVDLYHKLDVSLIRNLQPVARQQLAEGVTALTRWIDSNQITMPPEIFRRAEGLLKDLTGQCGEVRSYYCNYIIFISCVHICLYIFLCFYI